MKKGRRAVSLFLALMMLMTAAVSEEQIEVLTDAAPATETVTQEPTEAPAQEPEPQPEAELTEEPTTVPMDEPTMEPTAEPEAELTEGPTTVPMDEPTMEPSAEPETEPTAEAMAEPLPAERLAAELGLTLEELAEKLAVDVETLLQLEEEALRAMLEQVESPEDAPTEEPSAEPTMEPTEEPTEEPTVEPTEEPTEEPAVEPEENGVEEIEAAADTEDPASKMYTPGCNHEITVPYNRVDYCSVISRDEQKHVCLIQRTIGSECKKCGALTECVIGTQEELTENHTFSLFGYCSVCNYKCEHEGYASFYWVDDTDFMDYFDEYDILLTQHRRLLKVREKRQKYDCQICGWHDDYLVDNELTYSQPEAHTFDEKGVCTVCGYENRCRDGGEHEYDAYGGTWYYDSCTYIDDQYHEKKGLHEMLTYECIHCSSYYNETTYDAEATLRERHKYFENDTLDGYCDICNHKANCDHQSYSIYDVYDSDLIAGAGPIKDNGNGTHSGKLIRETTYLCDTCGMLFDETRIVDGTQACRYDEYDEDADAEICRICGARKYREDCMHDDPSQLIRVEEIEPCGIPTPNEDGKGHTYSSYEIYWQYFCKKCEDYTDDDGLEIVEEPYTEYHDLDPITGECAACDYIPTCAHEHKGTMAGPRVQTGYGGWLVPKDSDMHYEPHVQYEICQDCNSILGKLGNVMIEAPHEFLNNGTCLYCDYVAGSTYPVTRITLSTATLALGMGQSQALTATVFPDYATNKGVTWKSDNDGVVTVVDGKVTAAAVGTATITCTAADGSGVSVSCTVTVTPGADSVEPTNVSLSPKSGKLGVGQTLQLVPVFEPENASSVLTYTSSNKKVATVSANGLVKAVKKGSATITAKTSNGKKATCKVTVLSAPSSVKLNKTTLTLAVQQSEKLKATLSKDSATTLSWESSQPDVATVASDGTITAVGVGETTISVKTHNYTSGKSKLMATCKVTVKSAPKTLTVPEALTLGKGETYTLKPEIEEGSYGTFSFKSSNANIVKVSKKGKLTALKTGTATITVRVNGTLSKECTVTVAKAPSKVTLSPKKASINVGETFEFTATLPSGTASKLTTSSTKASVATITQTEPGKFTITAKKAGKATITVKTFNGKSAKFNLTVK